MTVRNDELDHLAYALAELYRRSDERLREEYRRSLSFQDALFDRWERARRLNFSEGASIYNSAEVFGEVLVGAKTWVGPYVILDGSAGGVRIGDYCSISAGVHIYTHDTVAWALTGGKAPIRQGNVSIGDCCHIGSQSVIAPGVSIGSHSVVGANSFVNRDIKANHVYAGSPAKPIGTVVIVGDSVHIDYFQ